MTSNEEDKLFVKAGIELAQRGYAGNLNRKEIAILILIRKVKTISEVSRELKIDYKNVWRYLRRLVKMDLVLSSASDNNQGRRIYVWSNVLLPKELKIKKEELKTHRLAFVVMTSKPMIMKVPLKDKPISEPSFVVSS